MFFLKVHKENLLQILHVNSPRPSIRYNLAWHIPYEQRNEYGVLKIQFPWDAKKIKIPTLLRVLLSLNPR